jgi:hypothetical protein
MSASKQKKTIEDISQQKQSDTKHDKDSPAVTPEQRYRMVQESAYYIAEKAHFNGDSMQHWLTAEREFEQRFE